MQGKTIIPVASGKGGVGKSFFTANLAMALAEKGYDTIAVDADLGGSNLHYFLGLANRFPGIGDFLKARSAELADLTVSTHIPNLRFIPGDGRIPFMANIPYAQKLRLISRIEQLPADYILLDLGAGTAFNIIDLFRITRNGILITTPDYPALMSMLTFLKHFILRIIERTFAADNHLRKLLHRHNSRSAVDSETSLETLHAQIAAEDPQAGRIISGLCREYRPRIIFNRGEYPQQIETAEQIGNSIKKNLFLEADFFGFIFEDTAVCRSVSERVPFLPHFRESRAANSILRVAERVDKFWHQPVQNSAQHLLNRVQQAYQAAVT